MAAKSYLGRIAAPLAPGQAALAPLRTAAAEDARIPQEVAAPLIARRRVEASEPAKGVPAAPQTLPAAAPPKQTVAEPATAPVVSAADGHSGGRSDRAAGAGRSRRAGGPPRPAPRSETPGPRGRTPARADFRAGAGRLACAKQGDRSRRGDQSPYRGRRGAHLGAAQAGAARAARPHGRAKVGSSGRACRGPARARPRLALRPGPGLSAMALPWSTPDRPASPPSW